MSHIKKPGARPNRTHKNRVPYENDQKFSMASYKAIPKPNIYYKYITKNIKKLRFLYMHHLNIFILVSIEKELPEFRVPGVGPVFFGLPSPINKKSNLSKLRTAESI